ncbi:uncharacterized protein LOC131288391 [Anopheles ziemanni]|uniref:uncharacterized protein LOC131259213 n=1 Tax=Anopheles coustani TaxID=139045 RepID=UPI00265A7DDB|nr:uncharacterized protein LOC131259213 [Anopheles coustani]XP_058173505.1 uncharacterized protein LOC131288391 [Anopheles ziemanni]
MLSGRIRRRALALLGALLLVILVWPPCCATMPKPLPAALPMGPWEKSVPPSRPHPAAIAVPVPLPLQQHGPVAGTHLKRHGSSAAQGKGSHDQQQDREPPDSREDSRTSGRESEFYRFMRVLNHSVESNERRQLAAVSETVAGQFNMAARENSPPRPYDYLIESIDKNKPRTTRTVPAGDKDARVPGAQFDDMTGPPAAGASLSVASSHPSAPPTVLARSRRNAAATPPPPPAAIGTGNPHRHQHKLPPGGDQQLNATATGVWHGRRGGGGRQQQQQLYRNIDPNLDRNERAANLSHISGATRKIQLFIKNRYVQLLPDGTVNGTHDDLSDYTILQRTTVGIGQIKIQAVATCLFLCMDTCGSVYGSKEFSDDCIFNEQMEQHHYNTYSSTQHSNSRRTLYLALNKTGQPRKIQIPVNRTLGKLATYTKALTQTVAHERVEQLVSRLFGADHVRHGLSQLCETGQPLVELTAREMRPRPVCGGQGKGPLAAGGGGGGGGGGGKKQQQNAGKDEGKEGPRQKKKKKRRKCREDELPGEHCVRPGPGGPGGTNGSGNKKRPGGQQHSGQARQPGSSSISSGSSNSTSSVGSSSSAGGTNQSATSFAGHLSNGSSISSSNSSANSLIASISSGGPNRQGLPYAQLTATPNVRKPKPTRKQPANGGPGGAGGQRAASQQAPGGPTRKPKKPTQQPGSGSAGKRNGTMANKPGPARSKLVSAGVVPPKSNPKPASLTIARPARPSLGPPFLLPSTSTTTTTTTTTTTLEEASSSNARTTVSNALQQDTSQQSEDAELDMDDVLQQSAELADDLDELDEVPGSPTASSWHELLPARSVSEQRGRYKALSCCSFLSLSSLVVYGATVHLLYL